MIKYVAFVVLLTVIAAGIGFYYYRRSVWVPIYHQFFGKRTVAEAVTQFGPAAEERLVPFFQKANVPYPPTNISFVGLKEEKRLELWIEQQGRWVLVKSYDVKKASGKAGPKLREGDQQVPEGFYRIQGFNPNSSYHLSLKLNYPNEFDLKQAKLEGRTRLGGNIFIHGKAVSIGCLAMGDEAIEEIFVLASRVGKDNISVLLAPRDFRRQEPLADARLAPWVNSLYSNIHHELRKYQQ